MQYANLIESHDRMFCLSSYIDLCEYKLYIQLIIQHSYSKQSMLLRSEDYL